MTDDGFPDTAWEALLTLPDSDLYAAVQALHAANVTIPVDVAMRVHNYINPL